jgi:uncharacterized protein (UPF0147 family)
MVGSGEVLEFLEMMCKDPSISKSVKKALDDVRELLNGGTDVDVKFDAALQKVEGLSLDPNLASYARTQIWSLTSLLEDCART